MIKKQPTINLQDYQYYLPDEKIAQYPIENRDHSKLLYYDRGKVKHKHFTDIVNLLPEKSTLFFNNTKVIPARLYFHKASGAQIEIFLLKPQLPSEVLSIVMEARQNVTWECMVGNYRKWKEGTVLSRKFDKGPDTFTLQAAIIDRDSKLIRFSWDNEALSFAEIVSLAGQVPLPPYLNRKATEADKPRYQTVYSKKEGAVAAPTAGLHFTNDILTQLEQQDIRKGFLTLHVSAGTFQPIKATNITDHPMHAEQMVVSLQNIQQILSATGQIIAVGTTSMRTLESLYWFGVRLLNDNEDFAIGKLEPYQKNDLPGRKKAFEAILQWMHRHQLKEIIGTTEIFIFPGYQFHVCDGLVTNFHQPGSTLILLVAALIGDDWKKVYSAALENDYRFLSYGDSSLLLPSF